ncbi:uncharacterized protein with NRDE domain [Jezberella montanilacus]|uniref:Uncharacterized protein with NRDE domain n=1 Tax=Jezberella montanilacus TaxID=323426 RepID=A0A2T0XJ72_9BURK|nr:NRDE family protein [Jezberella montanilacus]PRY98975.1 uncharacterized protein with NRDE domain [Jezberella montanilacus]
MCLAVIAYRISEKWPLVIVTNRDEFHARDAIPVGPWTDHPSIIAGRDVTGGGTWLGLSTKGRIALLTNVREPGRHIPDAPTRGQLTERFLLADEAPADHALSLQTVIDRYNGFNLLIGHVNELWYVSNRSSRSPHKLDPGIYGLSNAELQTPWPKLIKTRDAVATHLKSLSSTNPDPDHQFLFDIMNDRQAPPDDQLPLTGVGIERERMLGSPFIKSETYGTRCTTAVMFRQDGTAWVFERTFDPDGQVIGSAEWCVDTQTERIELPSVNTNQS